MNLAGSLTAAFLVGLLGGVHCVGMCGGIVGTLTAGLPGDARSSLVRVFPYQLAYNGGRIGGYTLAGTLMGALGTLMVEVMPLHYAQRVLYALAAAFMILLGLYLGGWWHEEESVLRDFCPVQSRPGARFPGDDDRCHVARRLAANLQTAHEELTHHQGVRPSTTSKA